MSSKYTRRSHSVPRVYLKGFANGNGRLLCRRDGKMEPFPISISDATVLKDFYSLPGHPGGPDMFEHTLGRFEQGYPKWRSQLEKSKLVTGPERLNFAGYLAFQILRGEAFYNAVSLTEGEDVPRLVDRLSPDEMRSWLAHQGYPCPVGVAQYIRLGIISGKIELEVGSRAFVQYIDKEVESVRGHLVSRRWQFCLFRDASLITADQPITLLDHGGSRSTDIYAGLSDSSREIVMPISRNIGLSILPPSSGGNLCIENGECDLFREGSIEEAWELNRSVKKQRVSAIFAHPDDASLLSAPEP